MLLVNANFLAGSNVLIDLLEYIDLFESRYILLEFAPIMQAICFCFCLPITPKILPAKSMHPYLALK